MNELEQRYPVEVSKICRYMDLMGICYNLTPFPTEMHETLKAEVKMLFSKIDMAEKLRRSKEDLKSWITMKKGPDFKIRDIDRVLEDETE